MPPPTAPPSRRAAVGLLTLTHVTNDFYTGAVPPLLPFFVAERHYGYTAVSGLALAATLLSSVVQPLFGVWADRRRMRWVIGAGMCTAALGVAASGLTDSYVITCLLLALSGVGVAAYHPEATRAARHAAGRSAQAMSWFSVGGNIGLALSPVAIAGLIGAWRLGATPLLGVPALVMMFVLAARRRMLDAPAPGVPDRPHPAGDVAGTPAAGDAAGTPAAVCDDWAAFRVLIAVIVARSIGTAMVNTFVALFIVHRFGQSSAVGSAALSIVGAAGIAGTLLGGFLADRFGRVRTIAIAYATAAAALTGMLNAPDLAIALALLVVLGIAEFVPFSVQVTLGHEYLPSRIGTASGVTLGLGITVGGAFAPVGGRSPTTSAFPPPSTSGWARSAPRSSSHVRCPSLARRPVVRHTDRVNLFAPRCPVRVQEQAWIERQFDWLGAEFGGGALPVQDRLSHLRWPRRTAGGSSPR